MGRESGSKRRPVGCARWLYVALAVACLAPALPAHGVLLYSASGATPGDIQPTVDSYRSALGPLNANVAGSFGTGRREINWDGVPDNRAAPNNLPADFFNANSPRGVVFSTPGTGFQVSADDNNPTSTPVEFGNLDPSYPGLFSTFSPQRLFTSLGSNVTEVRFFVPGSNAPALTKAFGAVFTDVNASQLTSLEYFDAAGQPLRTVGVQASGVGPTEQGLSFAGALFDSPVVARVRITAGTAALGPGVTETSGDLVAMDDFIYGEPAASNVKVEVFATHTTDDGGGAPYADPVGTFNSADVAFATNLNFAWHPFGQGVFGAAITGCITAPRTMSVLLATGSDDGSLLFLDGNLVVNNGGPHGPTDRSSGVIVLQGGVPVPFRIEFYEDFGGPSGVDLLMDTGDGTGFHLVPSSFFTQCAPEVPECFDFNVPGHPESTLELCQGSPPTLSFHLIGFNPSTGYTRTAVKVPIPTLMGAGQILSVQVVGNRVVVTAQNGTYLSRDGFIYVKQP